MTVAPMGADNVIILLQRVHRADRHGFLSDAEMGAASEEPLAHHDIPDLLLEEAYRQHVLVEMQQQLAVPMGHPGTPSVLRE